jgi:predicted outer membrane repeat protein
VSQGTLIAHDITFEANGGDSIAYNKFSGSYEAGRVGGAIAMLKATVKLYGCKFIDNFAFLGGAIHSAGGGSLTISGTSFEGNKDTNQSSEVHAFVASRDSDIYIETDDKKGNANAWG